MDLRCGEVNYLGFFKLFTKSSNHPIIPLLGGARGGFLVSVEKQNENEEGKYNDSKKNRQITKSPNHQMRRRG